MTLDDLGNLGEFVGAIAVVVTLVYLVIQIRQNTRTIRSASSLSAAQLSQHLSALIITNEEVARLYRLGLQDPAQLSEDQEFQFDTLLISLFRDCQVVFQRHRESILDEEEWRATRRNIRWVFRQPGVAKWWKSRRAMYSDSFCRFLEDSDD